MAVPNTNTFSLSDVITEVGAATPDLAACFAAAMSSKFDTNYVNDKNDLLEFRNYGHSQPFIISMRTTSSGESITIPTSGVGYNYNVDWGDGSTNTGRTGDTPHTYAVAGTYDVKISGVFPRIYFNSSESRTNLVDIKQWGSNPWDSFYNAFAFCSNLTQISATDTPNLSNVTDMRYMFYSATSFNADLSTWDVSNVTSMHSMFHNATSFNGDISNWNVSNVTSMYFMFYNATSFNGDLSTWNVGNVTDVGFMFGGAKSFNQDISNWDVSNVTDMRYMFYSATSFNADLSTWDVSNVTSMRYMFYSATSFNADLSTWNVSNVTSMHHMFYNATSFNQDISNWDVSNVTDMGYMFSGATSFNQDLSTWNVGNVTDMAAMFYNATSFNGNLSNWDVSNVTDMDYMFENAAGMTTTNYSNTLINWSTLPLQSNVPAHFGTSKYNSSAVAARAILKWTFGWTITDGGLQ